MAKWGEGDPRWIVEERADATNVNNWHWTEKNATPWSKDKLRSLLEGLVIDDEKYFCEIKEVTKIEGEASANNRKAKLFFFYEWEIKAEWKGKLKSGNKAYKGEIEIPNLSEEHLPGNVDINVSVKDGEGDGYEVKEFLRVKGVAVIREQLHKYIKDLKEEFSHGMILPVKDGATTETPSSQDGKQMKQVSSSKELNQSKDGQQPFGVKISCKSLTDSTEFKCSAADLFRTFIDRQMVEAFTRGYAVVDGQKYGRFSLFGGNICGEFTELVENKRIEMKWRFKTWPDEHYSNVVIELKQKEDCTELQLTQTGIPASDYERTKEGWRNHYWQSIKQTFGFGALLF